jgi:ribbon-helix-helix CopG family protein
MARMKENPRYNVISLRLSDEEMDFLQEITRRDNKCISEIVRDALNQARKLLTNLRESR